MNRNKAFSLIEVIVSFFILFIALLPIVRLNLKEIENYNKISKYKENLSFFNLLVSTIQKDKFIIENTHIELTSLIDINNFFGIDYKMKEKNLKLEIYSKTIEVDYIVEKKYVKIIHINYENIGKRYSSEIIKIGV